MSIRVGIFFGGPSREREISFAGGRTVYDNLDKTLFEPIPIFVDSFRRWHLLDWQYLYRGSIRDFFPPVSSAPESKHGFQSYQESLGPLDELALEEMGRKVGRRIRRDELPELIDLAFLALHGEYGEDGQLQRELEYAGIPYTGSGVRGSEIGIDKALQKQLMAEAGFPAPAIQVIEREDFLARPVEDFFAGAVNEIGWPMVIRPARQGSSIGVNIINEREGLEGFERAVNAAFFRELLLVEDYAALGEYDRLELVRRLSDLRDGLAFPLDVQRGDHRLTLYTPDELYDYLEQAAGDTDAHPLLVFEAHQSEDRVIVEAFIKGREFSTIVLRKPDGEVTALPPTEIVKYGAELFDYRSKYLPGRSRKVTPIDLPAEDIQDIRRETVRLFETLGFATYARIDGFFSEDGKIFLNDPNTTSGMMPSSFFFHQAAEIGLNPSQFLTYIIHTALREREHPLLETLDELRDSTREGVAGRERIAVLLGGYSFERHISVESGRNIYEKLAAGGRYQPTPVFLTRPLEKSSDDYELYRLPLNLLLKDNADDIRDRLRKEEEHPIISDIRRDCAAITSRFADPDVVFHPRRITGEELGSEFDAAFIALHGRPGEDGRVQADLEKLGLPYNGSPPDSAALTIDKYATLQALKEAGMPVTDQYLASADDFFSDESAFYDTIEERFGYPLIAKPVDDGCSSAVKLIRHRDELHAYCRLTFRPDDLDEAAARRELKLSGDDDWPLGKDNILFEAMIGPNGAIKFLEITGGMLTHRGVDGKLRYEVFEPSEALAGGEVLSLEEKFLAGEGQNLTPARLATEDYSYDYVAGQVKADLERAARILGVTGYCRIDAFVRVYEDGRVETIVIEVNSLPGMTPATAIFHQAALNDYTPHDFIVRTLENNILPPSDLPAGQAGARRGQTTIVQAAAPEPEYVTATPRVDRYEQIEVEREDPERRSTLKWLAAFLTSGVFLRNLLAAVLFLVVCFLLLRGGLNWYTNHGDSMVLPTMEGLLLEEAEEIADEYGLKLNVEEGPFDPDRQAGTVVQQQPRAGSRVKNNRTIYLTVLTDKAPMVPLPSLVGTYDYTQYSEQLRALGINYRVRSREFDPRYEDNTILYFFHEDRKITDEELRGGVRVPQGSTLEFVITQQNSDQIEVREYRCKRYGTVEFSLDASDLVIGEVFGNVSDRYNAFIERTEPPAGTRLPRGSKIDIYLSSRRPEGCD